MKMKQKVFEDSSITLELHESLLSNININKNSEAIIFVSENTLTIKFKDTIHKKKLESQNTFIMDKCAPLLKNLSET